MKPRPRFSRALAVQRVRRRFLALCLTAIVASVALLLLVPPMPGIGPAATVFGFAAADARR